MKALITGGAGFIGSHLAEALLAAGHSVIAIDNLATGSRDNIEHLLEQPHYQLVVDDVLNEPRIAPLVGQADVIFHLAAAVGVKWIIDHPLLSIRTNLRATEVVLEQASRHGTKVVLASTSEVYGKNDGGPLREDADSIIGPTAVTRWLYANTKATDEFLAYAYHRERALPVVIARFFNTVGPRQTGQYGMVVPRFVRQALRNEPITIYGDGCQSRCFTDVRDTVRALIRLSETPAAIGEVFNIGNAQEITIRELAGRIVTLTGSVSPLQFIPYHQAYDRGFEDMRRRVPDVSKLRRTIGYTPHTPLEENLTRIIQHMLAAEPGLRARPAVKTTHARVRYITEPPPASRVTGRSAKARPAHEPVDGRPLSAPAVSPPGAAQPEAGDSPSLPSARGD
jgi:UDP-glucose 4-epimerase